jgi:hypothetical protein
MRLGVIKMGGQISTHVLLRSVVLTKDTTIQETFFFIGHILLVFRPVFLLWHVDYNYRVSLGKYMRLVQGEGGGFFLSFYSGTCT